jgi:hypothetical protein
LKKGSTDRFSEFNRENSLVIGAPDFLSATVSSTIVFVLVVSGL